MLAPATLHAADGYWTDFLGVAPGDLRPAAAISIPHAAELGDRGMYAQSFGAGPLVSLPADLLARFGGAAAEAARGGLVDDDRWRTVFGGAVEAVIGPAAISYADAGTFRDVASRAEVRALGDADRPALDLLRAAMSDLEWGHGGGDYDGMPVFGAFAADGTLAARAGYEVWGGRIANLGVVTHPAYRGQGLGAAVFAHAARAALDAGLMAQHRALQSNTQSMSIARRLGFVPYATSLAVRLRDA